MKRSFQGDFHNWKVIPLFLIGKHLGTNFKFHNNIDINNDIFSKFPSFYQDIFIKWINNLTAKPTVPSTILSEFIWFNSNIKVESKPKHFSFFFLTKNLTQWFYDNGNTKPCKDLKIEYHLKDTDKTYWLEIIDALPKTWKNVILKEKGNTKYLVTVDHHILRISQIWSVIKLTSKELYLILVDANTIKLTAKDYFKNIFETFQFNWIKNIL